MTSSPATADALSASERAPLERGNILQTAVELVDRDGLDGLSMRALAEELGVGTMSLYHHVPNKEALLAGITEVLLSEMVRPEPAAGPWPERAMAMARSFHDVALRHPNCATLLVTHPFVSDSSLQPCEVALDLLVEAGFEPERALLVFRTIVAFVLGFVTMESNGFFAESALRREPDELAELGLTRLAEAAPCMHQGDPGAAFDEALTIVLAGCAADLAADLAADR